jgi:metal-responsive CopG/Arc/MetJ family transcriptional regulator
VYNICVIYCGGEENMAKKVIQVPMDPELLEGLDRLCGERRLARAEVIRESCREYLKKAEEEELDRAYLEGYERVPEEPEAAAAQVKLAKQVLPGEKW